MASATASMRLGDLPSKPGSRGAQLVELVAFVHVTAVARYKAAVAADSSSSIAVPQDPLDTARDVLRETFGHTDFRGLQAGVIGEILAGRSALAVLPTGGGKSLCYQIPSLVRPGVGLVAGETAAARHDLF